MIRREIAWGADDWGGHITISATGSHLDAEETTDD